MKTNTIQLLLLATITALSAVLGPGCKTMEGAGKDIEKAGNKIQDAAK
jgi:predicted small secreted protein